MYYSFSYKTTPQQRFNHAVSVLIILVMFLLLFYFITFSWYGGVDTEDKVITVGNISVAVTTDLDFSGIYLEPYKQYSKQTTIIGSSQAGDVNTNDAYIRVKFETTQINGENIIIPIYNASNWVYDSGTGWYYYIGIINQSTSATFNSALQVTTNLENQHQGTVVDITLTVDALQKEYNAYVTTWADAPSSWVTAIQSI